MELLAGFLTDATPSAWFGEDFGGLEDLLVDGQMFGDARGAGFFDNLLVGGDLSRRSWVCGIGGGGFFCEVGSEHEFELGGVELLAGGAKNSAAEHVDGLLEADNLSAQARIFI